MRLKLLAFALAGCTALYSTAADAAPLAFLGGILTSVGLPGLGGALFGLSGGTAFGVFAAGYSFLGGLGGALVSTALQFGISYLQAQNKPKAEGVQGNVASSTPVRSLIFGTALVGGNLVFSESSASQVYYAIHHCDNECVTTLRHWFNDVPLTLNGSNDVTNSMFVSEGNVVFRIEPFAGTVGQTVSTILNGAFPEWDASHRGVSCCYTAILGRSLGSQERPSVYKHRGPLGTGEPAYFREGNFGRCHDPRNPASNVNNPATWPWTRNAALILATFRIHPDGWNKHHSTVNWDRIAAAANICDQMVTGRDGYVAPRYELSVVIPFNEPRRDAEKRMLEAIDGMRFFDEQGRWYIRPGYYEAPTVTLTNRDIIDLEVVPDGDGETEKNSFVAAYTDRRLLYKTTTSAAWLHPDYSGAGISEQKEVLELPEVGAHNQAVRVCKAVGLRTRSPRKLGIVAGLRAMRLREERFVALSIGEPKFDGNYEIMGFEESEDGMAFGLQLVGTGPGNWDLLAGEEGPLPTYSNSLTLDTTIPVPSGLSVAAVPIQTSTGKAVRLEANFTPPANASHQVKVEYRRVGDAIWLEMISVSEDGLAYSPVVDDGQSYQCRAYTESSGGGKSGYTAIQTVLAVADTTVPGNLSSISVAGGLGRAAIQYTTFAADNLRDVAIYRVPAGSGPPSDGDIIQVLPVYVLTPAVVNAVDGDATRTNMATNGTFAADANWTKGAGWTIAAGVAAHAAGSSSNLQQAQTFADNKVYRTAFDVTAISGGSVNIRLFGGTTQASGVPRTATGTWLERLTEPNQTTNNNLLLFNGTAAFVGSIDNVVCYEETPTCAPQGAFDYYLKARNGSKIGNLQGPYTATII